MELKNHYALILIKELFHTTGVCSLNENIKPWKYNRNNSKSGDNLKITFQLLNINTMIGVETELVNVYSV